MLRKRDRSGELTIFFATDVHGSNVCFKKFIGAAKFYGAAVLILGGDVTGEMVVPIARQADGRHLTSFAGNDVQLGREEQPSPVWVRVEVLGLGPKE